MHNVGRARDSSQSLRILLPFLVALLVCPYSTALAASRACMMMCCTLEVGECCVRAQTVTPSSGTNPASKGQSQSVSPKWQNEQYDISSDDSSEAGRGTLSPRTIENPGCPARTVRGRANSNSQISFLCETPVFLLFSPPHKSVQESRGQGSKHLQFVGQLNSHFRRGGRDGIRDWTRQWGIQWLLL